jgi:hypothetical protein
LLLPFFRLLVDLCGQRVKNDKIFPRRAERGVRRAAEMNRAQKYREIDEMFFA